MSLWRRRPSKRPLKQTILIVGEGQETEPNYFYGLKREDAVRRSFTVTVKPGRGFTALDVVQWTVKKMKGAAQEGKRFDEAWCCIDVEEQGKDRKIPEARKLAEQNGIKIAWSNPSFERWFLSHFERSCGFLKDCDAVIAQLDKHWQPKFHLPYNKNDQEVYTRLRPFSEVAIENARWALEEHFLAKDIVDDGCNSATEVYRLVSHLLGA